MKHLPGYSRSSPLQVDSATLKVLDSVNVGVPDGYREYPRMQLPTNNPRATRPEHSVNTVEPRPAESRVPLNRWWSRTWESRRETTERSAALETAEGMAFEMWPERLLPQRSI